MHGDTGGAGTQQGHSVHRAAACKGLWCAQGCGLVLWAHLSPSGAFLRCSRRHGSLCVLHRCWCGSGKLWVCKRFYFSSAGAAVAAGLEASSHPFSHLDIKHGWAAVAEGHGLPSALPTAAPGSPWTHAPCLHLSLLWVSPPNQPLLCAVIRRVWKKTAELLLLSLVSWPSNYYLHSLPTSQPLFRFVCSFQTLTSIALLLWLLFLCFSFALGLAAGIKLLLLFWALMAGLS